MARKKAFSAKYDGNEMLGSLPIEPNIIDSPSFRETIESIAVAIILAMIFKVLEAEAYIIPTGSMAPTLMGQHTEAECPQCSYWFQSGARDEGPSASNTNLVSDVRCPMCHFPLSLTRKALREVGKQQWASSKYDPNQESFSGDRIVVSKVEYIFRDPRRWDVIVFKYPGGAKTNYIKRLVGLPGEALLTNNGDVYVRPLEEWKENKNPNAKRAQMIARKPADKLAQIMFPVADTKYFSTGMRASGLPPAWRPQQLPEGAASQWSEFSAPGSPWQVEAPADMEAKYSIAAQAVAAGTYHWLRFRQVVPTVAQWEAASDSEPLEPGFIEWPGTLITDYYAYNDAHSLSRRASVKDGAYPWDEQRVGSNWVGDLIMEVDVTIESTDGHVALDAVEGGIHFLCQIDVATGKGTLSAVVADPANAVRFADDETLDSFSQTVLSFDTPLTGPGTYNIRYANCDDRIYLWVNGTALNLPGDGCYDRQGPLRPYYDAADPGDAQPLAFGVNNCAAKVDRLKVFRDLYYLNAGNSDGRNSLFQSSLPVPPQTALQFYLRPQWWNDPARQQWFAAFDSDKALDWERCYVVDQDQFFPMGDNSPQSQDARIWPAPQFVERRYMIGKALMVYWPHTWNSPPYWPNFPRMRLIH